jgi:Tol biopolymer transport system component
MSPDVPSLDDLIHAICEGTPVDWDALEQTGNASFRSKVAALRVVAGIARVHRTEPTETPASGGTPPDVPRRWGHLDVLEHIASGAFGDVYRAWDPQLDREVALKLLRRASDAGAHTDEVVDEGRLLARLRHPHIVSIYGAARIDGRVGLWMEYLRGSTLAQVVAQNGAMAPVRVAGIGVALGDALAAVHGAGQVHRDVKAQNVMLADDGRVVLMDFGAGRDVRHAALDTAGTPLYLAPEVARGAPASPQSDIYSLGVLLRYALTGRHRPSPATPRADPIHRRVSGLITRATALEPADRFDSASSFAHALRTASIPSTVPTALMTVAAGLILLLLIVSTALVRLGDVGEAERQWSDTWRTAAPSRVALTAEMLESVSGFSGGSAGETMVGVAQLPDRQWALVTIDVRTGAQQRWMSYDEERGHVDRIVASLDGTLLAYAWVESTCRCASLRVVNDRGETRVLLAGDDIRAIWLGGWSRDSLPAVVARTRGNPELVLVDVASGTVRPLKQSLRTPRGLGLSPDGRFLVLDAPRDPHFDRPRDIVVIEIATRREWRLVEGPGDRLAPVWSPNGDRVFYLDADDRGTTLVAARVREGRLAGIPWRLHDLGEVSSISASAGGIWYWKATGPADVFVVALNPAGAPESHIRMSDGAGLMPAWSPDGRWLAWCDRGRFLHLEDRSAAHAHRTIRSLLDSVVLPVWSRDSRRIAFWSLDAVTHSLEVVDLATGAVTEPLRMAFPNYGGEFGLAWLPGDRELLVSLDSQTLEAVDVATGKRRTVYAANFPSFNYFFVSPDGNSIALDESRGDKRRHTILGLDGRDRQAGLDAVGVMMGWDPDGRHLIEVRWESRQSGPFMHNELWRVPLDGSGAQSMGLSAPGMIYVSLAPDGRTVAYGTATFSRELWTLSPTSGTPAGLTVLESAK